MELFRKLAAYKRESPLGWKVLVQIVAFTAAMALVLSAIQMVVDYHYEAGQVDSRIEEYQRVNAASIASALWNFDRTQIDAQLRGLLQLPNVEYASVVDNRGSLVGEAGEGVELDKTTMHRIPLIHDGLMLGELRVHASLRDVYARVGGHAMVILLTQTVTLLFASVFVLLIFNRLVSQPLARLARQARHTTIHQLDREWSLERRAAAEDDELNVLVRAMNQMRLTLRGEVQALERTKEALSESEAQNRSLMASSNVVPWIAEAGDWRLTFIGPQADARLGMDTAAWTGGSSLLEHIHADDRQSLLERAAAAPDGQFELECRFMRADGGECWIHLQGTRKQGPAGQALYQGYLQNIDARKTVEIELDAYRRGLETLVSERTSALQQQNEALAQLNAELQAAQSQLLQSEKLASIGQLAAGVAHEINNPVGYVSSNLGSLSAYVKDFLSLIAQYEVVEAKLPSEAQQTVEAAKRRIDLPFLRDDVDDLLTQSHEGLLRVKKIVQDLKDFSRIDGEDSWQKADLVACLESTLNIVNNELKYKADLVRRYSAIPEVTCLPSQLNQVFLNLLVNAGHAIDGARGTVTVSTGCDERTVWVEIADTGRGIEPEIINRIFDPFFTTKPIGKGTGLGLSISYGIIKKHNGTITVQSEVGNGTTFRVALPIEQPEAA